MQWCAVECKGTQIPPLLTLSVRGPIEGDVMTIRLRYRRPAPVARKVCKPCVNRRALFRQEGIQKWDPYYALCYKCYQRWFSRAHGEPVLPAAADTSADRRHRTPALETGLQPAQ